MRLLIIVGLCVALAYILADRFAKPEPPRTSLYGIAPTSPAASLPPAPVVPTRAAEVYIGTSPGVVTLGTLTEQDEGWLYLYNEDGTLWYRFSVYDEVGPLFDKTSSDFAPICFHVDYFCLALRQVGDEGDRWRVVVNEESGLTKFVRKDDSTLRFVTWREYLFGDVAFALDEVHISPYEGAKFATPPIDAIVDRIGMEGDWIEVNWRSHPDSTSKARASGHGWIRWRKNGYFLLQYTKGC